MRTVHHRDGHLGWDRRLEPVETVASGTMLTLHLADCFAGQLTAEAGPRDVAALDLDRANPLTGPVYVEGAQPGDTLAIHIEEVTVGDVGWTTLIPGFGLLAEDFPDPHVVVSRIGGDKVDFGGLATLMPRPFLGTIGVAPAAPGPHSVIPPRRVGGNLDCRDVRPGATLLLPVEVDGALLSAGDPHAAQGDGEVCGTAVETTASATLRVEVRRDLVVPAPQLSLPPATSLPQAGRRHVTMGVGTDLLRGTRDAVRAMIDHLEHSSGLAPADAYALCSVAAHVRIVEVVDAPNWVVACDLDLGLLS